MPGSDTIRRLSFLVPVVVLGVTAAVYLPTLGFEFVCDDNTQIVTSQPHLRLEDVPDYFTTNVWSYVSTLPSNYYRPMFLVWLMLNSQLFSVDPVLWHFSALLNHLAATLLFYFLARRILADPLAAGAAAMLFGLHPVHVEAVAWVSGASESLLAVFAFGTILCYLRWREEPDGRRRRWWAAASWLLCGFAILSKETAAVLPAAIAVFEWLLRPAGEPGSKRLARAVRVAIPYVAVLGIYLLLRIHALEGFAPRDRGWTLAALARTLPLAIGYYLRLLLVPIQYSFFYPVNVVRVKTLTTFWAPLTAAVLATGLLVWICRRSHAAAFGVALLVLPLLPVFDLAAFPFDDYVHDRYLYIPVAGLCILLAVGLLRLAKRPRAAVFAAVAVGLAAATLWSSRPWANNLALYTHGVEVAPGSVMALNYYSGELVIQKRYEEALTVVQSALLLDPERYDLYNDMAMCYAELGRYDEALLHLRDAIRLAPDNSHFYFNLAAVELRQGRVGDAETHARQALKLRPSATRSFARYHAALGAILEAKGDLRGALGEYREELKENPADDDIWGRVHDLSLRTGRTE